MTTILKIPDSQLFPPTFFYTIHCIAVCVFRNLKKTSNIPNKIRRIKFNSYFKGDLSINNNNP